MRRHSCTLTDLNALDAEWTIDAQIGEEPRLLTEFYQPLSLRGSWFIAPASGMSWRRCPT